MLVMSPSGGPVPVASAPVPLASRSWLLPDESNAIAVLYPVPNGGEADSFSVQDPNGQNSIDISQTYVYATIPGDTPLADSFYYRTV